MIAQDGGPQQLMDGAFNPNAAPGPTPIKPVALPKTTSTFAQMPGAPGAAPGAPPVAPPVAAPGAPPAAQATSTTGAPPAGASAAIDTNAMVPRPTPSPGSIPTTGFAPPAAPVAPVAIGSSASFSPTNNSVGSVVAPQVDTRLAGMQGATDSALAGVTSAPDRFALAQEKLGTFTDQTDPEYQASMRDANKFASATGTSDSGMLRTRYGNLALQRGRDVQNERDTLYQNAADQTMNDRLATLSAARGTEGQVNSQDAGVRQEQRGERDYQANRGDTALEQFMQQKRLEDQLTTSGVDRGVKQTELGYGNDPALAQLTAAGQQGASAASSFQGVGQLMQLLAASRSGTPDYASILRSLPQYGAQ